MLDDPLSDFGEQEELGKVGDAEDDARVLARLQRRGERVTHELFHLDAPRPGRRVLTRIEALQRPDDEIDLTAGIDAGERHEWIEARECLRLREVEKRDVRRLQHGCPPRDAREQVTMEIHERERFSNPEPVHRQRFKQRRLAGARAAEDERMVPEIRDREVHRERAAAGDVVRCEGGSLPLALGRDERVFRPEGDPSLLRSRRHRVE
ncbi:MAG TPA: hypothetical protein VF883_23400 [Thermoanaerobaculia bacterium]